MSTSVSKGKHCAINHVFGLNKAKRSAEFVYVAIYLKNCWCTICSIENEFF